MSKDNCEDSRQDRAGQVHIPDGTIFLDGQVGQGTAAAPSLRLQGGVPLRRSAGGLTTGPPVLGFRGPTRPPVGGAWVFSWVEKFPGGGMDPARRFGRYQELQSYVGW